MLAENFGEAWIKIDLPFPCEIHYCRPRAQPRPDRFSVLLLSGEPAPLRMTVDEVRGRQEQFDLILTADPGLLDLPQARFFIFGDIWVDAVPREKTYSLSYLWSRGIGQAWDGYRLREQVWQLAGRIVLPKRFWYSRQRPPEGMTAADAVYPYESKAPLFESMFSLAIENIREESYFSEKLLDAFRTYTLPIYFGCPNIADYFNADGIIVVDDADDLVAKVNRLTPDDYWDRVGVMAENRARAGNYADPVGRLRQLIVAARSACP